MRGLTGTGRATLVEQLLTDIGPPCPQTPDRSDKFNRNHWVVINRLRRPSQPGVLRAAREGNLFDVSVQGVSRFTLLLSPEEVDFSAPVTVRINGVIYSEGMIAQSRETLLSWARTDLDRTMLFTAELPVVVPVPLTR